MDPRQTVNVKKVKKKIINLDYQGALKELSIIATTSPKKTKRGQSHG